MKPIDLRSDTVTRPSAEMRRVIADAAVGDDVYAEDPTVNLLERKVAALLGKERSLFVATGVMSNQLGLKALTQPGDEVIVGADSHIFNYETGAPAMLSGIQLHTIPDPSGTMTLQGVEEAIREEAYYLPPTRVVAIEQTHNRAGGAIIPLEAMRAISDLAHERGISVHLDGARLFNAVVETGVEPSVYAGLADTVSICLSKGLGAPIGSVLSGTGEQIEKAHRFRKVWGGGWRQAGLLAAGGLYALENNVERLREDHLKAREFARLLRGQEGLEIPVEPQTNIVLLLVDGIDTTAFASELARRGLLISAAFKGKLRAVFHMDVTLDEVKHAAEIITTTLTELSQVHG